MRKIILTTLLLFVSLFAKAQSEEVKEHLKSIETQYNVSFIYDSSLDFGRVNLSAPKSTLDESLHQLFAKSKIAWEVKDQYVLLKLSARFSIGGVVRDAASGEPLIGATIIVDNTLNGAYTNEKGFFSLSAKQGCHRLTYHYIGYKTKSIVVDLQCDTLINTSLSMQSQTVDEVVVVGDMNSVENTQIGRTNLTSIRIKSTPALLAESDVIKSLQTVAGVQSSSEGKSDLVVRGGSPDQNLILLDDMPLYNMNHVFGFFSVFNTDAISGVSFYKSSFPARFGERLSSVVDIHTKEGNKEKFTGSASLGLLTGKVNLEIPIIKGRTSLMLSGRRSFLDLFMGEFQEDDNMTLFKFYDLNAKLHHRFSDRLSMSLSGYLGEDKLSNDYTPTYHYDDYTIINSKMFQKWQWGNRLATASIDYIASPSLTLKSTLHYNRYSYNTVSNQESEVEGVEEEPQFSKLLYSSQIEDFSFNIGGNYTPTNRHHLRFGAVATHHRYRPEALVIENNNSQGGVNSREKSMMPAEEIAAYIEDDWKITDRLRTNVGLRYSLYAVEGKSYQGVDPRISLNYSATDKFSLKAGYSIMQQYIHLLSSSSMLFQTDLWVPATDKVPPMRSSQYTIGGYLKLPYNLTLSSELYYKDMSGVIEYGNGASFEGVQSGWEDKVTSGIGRAYGVEFTLERRVGKTTGALSYTLSRSERKFDDLNGGEWFLSKYDRTHVISANVAHKFNDKWSISASWIYQSGSLLTIPLEQIPTLNNPFTGDIYSIYVDQIDSRNNYRSPAYHRLDLGVNYTRNRGNKERYGVWNFTIYNAYNRMNTWNMYVMYGEPQPDGTIEGNEPNLMQTTLFPIIPSVSYTYHF